MANVSAFFSLLSPEKKNTMGNNMKSTVLLHIICINFPRPKCVFLSESREREIEIPFGAYVDLVFSESTQPFDFGKGAKSHELMFSCILMGSRVEKFPYFGFVYLLITSAIQSV